MEGKDRDGEAGLLDVTGLSLGDLSELDDSVVANALLHLTRRGCGAGEDSERFSNFNSSL